MRRWRFDKVQLVTFSEMSWPLGTISSELSKSRIMLARIPIRRMTPMSDLHLDDIADFHRSLKEKDQTGDEVVHDVLQTEADADTERAGEDGELRHVDSERGDRDKKSNEQNDVMQQGRDRVGRPAVKMEPIVNILLEQEADETREQRRDPDRQDEGENGAEGDMD